MKLSVIIPCHNAEATLAMQLEALSRQEWSEPWECIVADNRSTDGTRRLAEGFIGRIPGLKVVDASQRAGAAYARNAAARHACGESLAFCDADDLVADGWVAAMGNALQVHDLVACRLETTRLNPPWLHGHEQEHGLQKIWYPPWHLHAGGGSIGCKKHLFESLHGFDESMIYLEDTELCFQAQEHGVKMAFIADAVVHIRRRSSLWRHYQQSRNYAEYNVILARRYQPTGGFHWNCHRQFLKDCLILLHRIRQLRSEQHRYAWAWMFGRQVGRIRGMLRCGGMPV